jgi:Protein of unknown function (DUF2585)
MKRRPNLERVWRSERLRIGLAMGLIFSLAAVALRLEGHRFWCRCGRLTLWSGQIQSAHNSQHLVDPYTFTHMEHGLLLYALLRPFARWLGPGNRLVVAVAIEGMWEIAENLPAVIERYRQATIALGYAGDSVVNSIGDTARCTLGLFLAQRLPAQWSVTLFVMVELVLLAIYRDNLTLNVLMLVFPLESVKIWQMGR